MKSVLPVMCCVVESDTCWNFCDFYRADIAPRKRNCIVTLSEHWDYSQTAIANSMQGRQVLIFRRI